MAQLNDRRRGLIFAGVAAVLAAVGVYLAVLPGSGGTAESGTAARPTSGAQAGTATPATGAAAQTSAPAVAPATEDFDIYAYLPVSRERLQAAVDVAERFAATYTTFRYDEDPAAYAERLKAFTTVEMGQALTRSVTDPGLVQRNRDEQVVAEGSARLKSIRDISAGAVIFVVTTTQRLTTVNGPQDRVDDYAVTLTPVGDGWRVHDMEPASAGQEGDVP